jgi:hypothetical protein
MRALLCVVIVGCFCCAASAAEQESGFWTFGKKQEATVPQSADQTTAPATGTAAQQQQQATVSRYPTTASADVTPVEEPEAEGKWMLSSPLAKVSWPRLNMPKPQWSSSAASSQEAEPNRNAWVETPPATPRRSPMQAMKDGTRSFGQSTRKAWDKTKGALTPGKPEKAPPSSRVARGNKRSIWKRMFAEPTEPQQPRTVTEWMAQDRLVP